MSATIHPVVNVPLTLRELIVLDFLITKELEAREMFIKNSIAVELQSKFSKLLKGEFNAQ